MESTDKKSSKPKMVPTVPQAVQPLIFSMHRTKEIKMMKNNLLTHLGTKLVFQKLPRHMRRRTMAHNVKRLPRRLHYAHLKQLQKSNSNMTVRKVSQCRRKQRRGTGIYHRKSKIRWLETHIWHAKRFHMVKKWGFNLPHRPCDKNFRACYRALCKHCLLQDISYYRCIQLDGTMSQIVNKIPCLGAVPFRLGTREGSALFSSHASKPIGPIWYLWHSEQNAVWIWSHPSYYASILKEVVFLLSLRQRDSSSNNQMGCWSNADSTVILSERKDLARLRLTGPLSSLVIGKSLKVPDSLETTSSKVWLRIFGPTATAQISPYSMLAITISDPRAIVTSRVKLKLNYLSCVEAISLNKRHTVCTLWTPEKDNTTIPAISASTGQELPLICGTFSSERNNLDIMAIYRPGSPTIKLGCANGWDIILPAKWTRHVWQALVMRGARVGGLREMETMRFEFGLSELLGPDTKSGKDEERLLSEQNTETYFRRPPNKRTNYAKFGIVCPFQFKWLDLVKQWQEDTCSQSITNISVIRDRKLLIEIQNYLSGERLPDLSTIKNALVPVRIVCGRGNAVKCNAIICLPNSSDEIRKKSVITERMHVDRNQTLRKHLRQKHQRTLKSFRRFRKRGGGESGAITVDENKIENPGSKSCFRYKTLLQNQAQNMRSLWLPEADAIRKSCDRQIIGWIKQGGFSLAVGQTQGIGYIAAAALPHFLVSDHRTQRRDCILTRNTTSRQYRWATVSIICEILNHA